MSVQIQILVGIILVISGQSFSKEETIYGYGAIEVFSQHTETDPLQFCLTYPIEYYTLLPQDIFYLQNHSDIDLCQHNLTSGELKSKHPKTLFLLSADGNCSVTSNFRYVSENGTGLILITKFRYRMNQSYNLEVFALMNPESSKDLYFNSTDEIQVRMYGDPGLDASIIVLGVIAVLCVIIGSYTGPYVMATGYPDFRSVDNEPRILEDGDDRQRTNVVAISVGTVLLLVIFITITLLLLYFFYKYLVYVFIVIFCIASTRATYCLFVHIFNSFDFVKNIPKIRNYGLHTILLAGVCVAITINWFIFRKDLFGWILQDFLGICFCIHVVQTLRMPNLKLCTVLLSLLFIYDIFFVFITPLFMKDGKSIMVEVATGGGNNSEAIPLLLKIPRLSSSPAVECQRSPKEYSLLGFGDIIIPGLLVCFAHTFDIMSGAKYRPYFVSTSIGYAVGIFGAFVALYLMSTGQPALLYIVPSTLLAIFSVGLCRKEVKVLWRGVVPKQINSGSVSDAGA